ncbi:ComEA family DNA-binding protein [Leeia aquatica]|uniref:Topoisomerase n=1 Tax=Leeia aquatica TaxID=2725557 RepID=A0A847SIW1_9NEIS|nr:helix-hairpin-helix domain-containing protein [Leeia aquatica]NLR75832.1 topoisomerase [Leeia aquatica]
MKKLFAGLFAAFAMHFALAAVNINTATQAQLESLKGVGPAKAKAIIEYRTKNGPFKTLDGLKNVSGIGDGIYNKIKGDITLSAAATTAKPAVPAGKPATAATPAKPAEPAKKDVKPAAPSK